MSQAKMELDMSNSILRLTIVTNGVVLREPWRSQVTENNVTGFVIELKGEKFILTNSKDFNNITYATASFIDEPSPLKLELVAIDHHCHLALFKCLAPEFLKRAAPLPFAENLTALQGKKVSVHEYSQSNRHLVTKKTIQNIESYWLSNSFEILAYDMNFSEKEKFYGGPLIYDNKIVGMSNHAKAIPLAIIQHFLNHPEGFPCLPFSSQILKHKNTRESLGLKNNQGGILVMDHFQNAKPNALEPGDVIVEIDGYPLKVDGTIKHPDSQNLISYTHLLRLHALGDELELKIIRKGLEKTCMLKLTTTIEETVAVKDRPDKKSTEYYAAHGVVIVALSNKLIEAMVKPWQQAGNPPGSLPIPQSLMSFVSQSNKPKTQEKSKVFVISKILPCEHTEGMAGLEFSVIKTIDGQVIKNMRHLMKILNQKPEDELHVILFEDNNQLVLPHLSTQESQNLLKKLAIPAQAPPALLEKHDQRVKRKREEDEADSQEPKFKITKTNEGFFNQKTNPTDSASVQMTDDDIPFQQYQGL